MKEISTKEMVDLINEQQAELDAVKDQKQRLELFGLPETKWTIARDLLALVGVIAIIIYIFSFK